MNVRSGIRLVMGVSLSLALATTAHAGPDEVTDRLMDEAASLLDVGMLRLELRLAASQTIPPTYSFYDWDNNEIVISTVVVESEWDIERAKQGCESWFQEVRKLAYVDSTTGKIMYGYERSGFADLFTHYGYTRTINGKATSEVAAELDRKFRLSFTWLRFQAASGEINKLACTGTLIEKGYSTKTEVAD